MRGTVGFFCFILVLQIFGWVGVTSSRLLAPNNDDNHIPLSGADQTPGSLKADLSPIEGQEAPSKLKREDQMKQEEMYKGVNKKLGSSPPSCEHKCYGCMPCEPTQVPTDTSRIGLQYTNYEPEGWKCKCGPSFYSP